MSRSVDGPLTGDLERLPFAVAYVVDGVIVDASDRLSDLFGCLAHDVRGERLERFIGPEERIELAEWLDSPGTDPNRLQVGGAGADGMPFVVDLVAGELSVDGGRWVSAISAGPPVLGPEDRAADYVRRSEWELLGVDSVLSHDVRGALRASTSFLSLLERVVGEVLPDDALEFLDTAATATTRADEMVERLVRLLRIGIRPLRVVPVSGHDVVVDALAVSRAEFAGGAIELDEELAVTAVADRGLLVECLAELLTNARKFAGASVAVVVSGEVRAGWVYLRVSDDGPGIPSEFAEAAFAPFRLLQAKGRFPGVGLGLATCREIARVHGGRCWIEGSTPPGGESSGTTVVLRLAAAK